MLGLLIANLVVSCLILAALMGVGVKSWLVARQQTKAAQQRSQAITGAAGQIGAALVRAAAQKQKAEKPDNVTDINRDTA